MKLSAIVVAMGLAAACAIQPNLDHRDAHAAVMPFHSESLAQMRDAQAQNSTTMQGLFEHVAIDGPSGNVRYRIA